MRGQEQGGPERSEEGEDGRLSKRGRELKKKKKRMRRLVYYAAVFEVSL